MWLGAGVTWERKEEKKRKTNFLSKENCYEKRGRMGVWKGGLKCKKWGKEKAKLNNYQAGTNPKVSKNKENNPEERGVRRTSCQVIGGKKTQIEYQTKKRRALNCIQSPLAWPKQKNSKIGPSSEPRGG